MKKRFCVETPKGGGDCFGYETKKERIMAAGIAAEAAVDGSKVYECIGDQCAFRGNVYRGHLYPKVTPLQVMIVAPLVIGGAILALREMRKL